MKELREFPGYFATEDGRIWSTKTDKFLKHWIQAGYDCVNFYDGHKMIKKTVHSLIADTFIGKRPHGMCIGHLDGNKNNNHLTNIRYVTYSENNGSHRIKHGTELIGENHPMAKLTKQRALEIKNASGSQREIAKTFSVSQYTVWKIKSGNHWSLVAKCLK